MHCGNKSDVPAHELAETKNVPRRFMHTHTYIHTEREREREDPPRILREHSWLFASERSSLRKDKCVSVWNDVSFLAVIRYAINARQPFSLPRAAPLGNPPENWHGFHAWIALLTTRAETSAFEYFLVRLADFSTCSILWKFLWPDDYFSPGRRSGIGINFTSCCVIISRFHPDGIRKFHRFD